MSAMEGEMIVAGAGALAARPGEVDVQVSTAKRYPRDPVRALARAKECATLTPEIARSCWYVRPVGDGKTVEGPSVRLAEILCSTWGNLRVSSEIVEVTADRVVAVGRAWDLESNAAVSSEVSKSLLTSAKRGAARRVSDAQVEVIAGAAQSIALRNAIRRIVGDAIVSEVLTAARRAGIKPATDAGPNRSKTPARAENKGWGRGARGEAGAGFGAIFYNLS